MLKIAFTGYYGMNNYGDDLFVLASTYGSNKYWRSYPSIVGREIEGINANFQVSKFEGLYSGSSALSRLYRMQVMLSSFIKNDHIILAGGSTISSDTSIRMRSFQKKLMNMGLAKMSAIGVSIGPFYNDEDISNAKDLLNKFEYISVRDQKSYNMLKDMNIETPFIFGRDIAGIVPLIELKEKTNNKKKTLGVSICNYESYTGGSIEQERKRNQAIIAGIKKMGEENKQDFFVKICVLNTHLELGDTTISQELAEELTKNGIENKVLLYKEDPLEMWEEIVHCDVFFSVRLHGAITAFLGEIPFVLVEYHEKCTSFLNDLGYRNELRIKADCESEKHVYGVLKKLFNDQKAVTEMKPKDYVKETEKTFLEAPWS